MRFIAGLLATLPLLSATAHASDPATSQGEDKLQVLLEDYSPGPPLRCLVASNIRKFRIIDRTAMVATRGRTIYVNRTLNPGVLREDFVPVYDPDANLICSGSTVSLNTADNFLPVTAVRLGEWVPYRRSSKTRPQ